MQPAEYWIEKLDLQRHPEGGFYKETYRSAQKIPLHALPSGFQGERNASTAIYFLIRAADKSMFHRIKSDELWHFHAGTPLLIYILGNDGLVTQKLGTDLDAGEVPQLVMPANHWFGARIPDGGQYTLSSCSVAPGFDFQDFEMASREYLLQHFPAQHEIINQLTPP